MNCKIEEIEKKIEDLQKDLDCLKQDPFQKYCENPATLDSYCYNVKSRDDFIIVTMGVDKYSTWINMEEIGDIERKLNCKFDGVKKHSSICEEIKEYQYTLVFRKC